MTRYFFAPETGNDANSGLTSSAPKRTTTAATALVLAGNQISWRCGEKVSFSGGTSGWTLSLKQLASPCVIDYYDDDISDRKPMFDAMTYLAEGIDDTNWTSLGDGRWQRNFAGEVSRMFAGTTEASIRAGSIGTPFGYVSSATAVTSTGKWHMLTASPFTVTMYTGSNSIAPPSFFDGLACVGNGIATAATVNLSRCSNITLNSLQVWGGLRRGFFLLAESGATSTDITYTDCEAHATGRLGSGFSISNTSVPGQYIDRVTLLRPRANAHSTYAENDGDSGRWGSQNGIAITGEVQNATVTDPIVEGGYRHSYIQAQCDGLTTKYIARNITIQKSAGGIAYVDGIDSDYGHGLDTDADGWLIDGVEIRNQIARSQFGGTGTLRGVRFINPRQATHPQNLNTAQCVWVQNWTSPDYRKVASVTLDKVVIVNSYNEPIGILEDRSAAATSAEAGFEANAVTIKNCTIADLTNLGSRTYSIDHQVQGTPFLNSGLYLTDNIFVTALASPLRRETSAGVQTAYDVNAYAQASGNSKYSSAAAAGLDPVTFLPLDAFRGGINTEAQSALASGAVAIVMFVEMNLTSTLRFNTSATSIDWNGQTWIGAGPLGAIEEVAESPSEQRSLRFTLSGIPTELLSVALQENIRNKLCSVYLGILDATTLAVIQAPRVWTGTLDQMPIVQSGETCTIAVTAEHAGATFARPKPLRYIDADQRRLYGDTCLQYVSAQAVHQDVWPAASYFRR